MVCGSRWALAWWKSVEVNKLTKLSFRRHSHQGVLEQGTSGKEKYLKAFNTAGKVGPCAVFYFNSYIFSRTSWILPKNIHFKGLYVTFRNCLLKTELHYLDENGEWTRWSTINKMSDQKHAEITTSWCWFVKCLNSCFVLSVCKTTNKQLLKYLFSEWSSDRSRLC